MNRLLVLLAAVFGAIALSGCETSVRTVVVLGDSISALSASDYVLQWERDDNYLPVTNAIVAGGLCSTSQGADETYWQARIPNILDKVSPDVVLVELGTNDGACVSDYPSRIDAFMARLPADKPVLWVNVGDRAVNAAKLNIAIAAAPRRHPNLQVLDYSAHFAAHPEWFVSAGSVHPNGAGQAELARWLLTQLRADT